MRTRKGARVHPFLWYSRFLLQLFVPFVIRASRFANEAEDRASRVLRLSHVRIFRSRRGLGFARFVHLRKSPFHDFIARVLRVRKSVRRCGEKAEEVPSAFYTHILYVLRHRVLEQSAEQFRIAEVRADREQDEQDINGKGLHMREAVCQVCGQRTAHVADHQYEADR